MFMLIEFAKRRLMQILLNKICVILRRCLLFIAVKFIVIILLVAEMKLNLVAVKLKCLSGKLLEKLFILLLLLARSLFLIYFLMKKKVIIKIVLVVFMINSCICINDLIQAFRERTFPYVRRLYGNVVHLEFVRKPCRVRSAMVAFERCSRLTNGLPRYLKV